MKRRKSRFFSIVAFVLLAAAIILNVFGLKQPKAGDRYMESDKTTSSVSKAAVSDSH